MIKTNRFCLSVAVLMISAAARGEPPAKPIAISHWRCHLAHGTQSLRRESGELGQINRTGRLEEIRENGGKPTGVRVRQSRLIHEPLAPAERHAVDFDDSTWQRLALPICSRAADRAWYQSIPLVCMRGRFVADEPAKIGDLRLTVRYRGGVAVFFNGQQVGRGHLPDDQPHPLAPAEDYPPAAFFDGDGKPIRLRGAETDHDQHRVRQIVITIPNDRIRPGVNVVSLQVHAAPLPESFLRAIIGESRSLGRLEQDLETDYLWPLGGVDEIELLSSGGAGFSDGSARPAGVRVWNRCVTQFVEATDFGDPGEPPAAVRIVTPRRGLRSGQVIIGSTARLHGLKAAASPLSGPDGAVIPPEAVQIRWGVPDGYRRRGAAPFFDGLADVPPAETPAFDELAGGSVMPVWITVNAPADARPGEYRGQVKLSMDDSPDITIPMEVRVVGWMLPDRPFTTIIDIVQSPDSVAMYYDVPMWSRRHWQLLDRTFGILGQGGCNSITLTLIRRTHFGNEHAMVPWVRQLDGSLTPDLSVAERYIRSAVRHLGRIPIVILYVWELPGGTHHAGGGATFTMDREILFSVKDPETGQLAEARGPQWGTPQAVQFFKPAIDGIRDILARHGIADSLMIGIAGDRRPSAEAVKTLTAAAPYAPWYVHSHINAINLHGIPVAFYSYVWPTGVADIDDPNYKRTYNFQIWEQSTGFMSACFPRQQLNIGTSPWRYRFCAEQFVLERGHYRGSASRPLSGTQGFGRLGADFWGVLDRHPAPGWGYGASRVGDTLLFNLSSRYPETEWRNLGINFTIPAMLSPGPDGALATVRLAAVREAAEENEARFFLERALADPKSRARLGEELAERCQQMLDERTRVILRNRGHKATSQMMLDSGMIDRADRLFILAGEAAGRLEQGQ